MDNYSAHDFENCLFHRQRSGFTFEDACLIHCGVHGQLSDSHPVSGGAVCTSAAKTEVPPPVSLTLKSHFNKRCDFQIEETGHLRKKLTDLNLPLVLYNQA